MRTLEPMSEIKRLVYGCVGIVVGTVVTRVAGFHVVSRHIALPILANGGLSPDDPWWLVLFLAGILIAFAPPMWFWLVRPVLSGESPTDASLTEEVLR